MTDAKQNISSILEDYKTIFFDEYTQFIKQQKMMRDGTMNDFAEVDGDLALERKLFDTPATLHSMLVENLNTTELKWFQSKLGGRWFAKNFKEFRASNKV